MNRAAKNVLRKLGTDIDLEQEREQRFGREAEEAQRQQENEASSPLERGTGLGAMPEEMLSESEKRHEEYRRRQAMGGRTTPAAERLPIMTAEERKARDKDRPKYHATEFEGPIEKLIEKYRDLEEVQRHLTLGQAMKYEFTEDGRILDRDGEVLYDGTTMTPPRK